MKLPVKTKAEIKLAKQIELYLKGASLLAIEVSSFRSPQIKKLNKLCKDPVPMDKIYSHNKKVKNHFNKTNITKQCKADYNELMKDYDSDYDFYYFMSFINMNNFFYKQMRILSEEKRQIIITLR